LVEVLILQLLVRSFSRIRLRSAPLLKRGFLVSQERQLKMRG
jgi:hypothetical protein